MSSNLSKSKNLIVAKSPPNGLSYSVQVPNSVEALIFLALAAFALNPLLDRLFLLFFLRVFTIWVPPVLMVCSYQTPLLQDSQMVFYSLS